MQLGAERVNLTKLLGTAGEQFQVPPFQRPYAWESEHIDDLWDDLLSALGRGHFLGSVVLSTEDEERPQVIDGQQRLTTLLMLLGLVRDQYHSADSPLWQRVQQLMYCDPWAEADQVFKLRLGDANWKVFRDAVLRSPEDEKRIDLRNGGLDAGTRQRNLRLIENYKRLHDKLASYVDGFGPETVLQKLEALETTLARKFDLVAIKVGSVGDAFLLFETLNDRGLQLSAADLLKNHLLSRVAEQTGSEDEVRRVAREWDSMLDDLGLDVDLSRFFRHFLLAHHREVSQEDVYDIFKRELLDTEPEAFLHELRIAARNYGQFEDPSRLAPEERSVRAVLEDLQTLRATRCYVTLLPGRRWLSTKDFERLARYCEILTFRYSTVAGLDAKTLEITYQQAAALLASSRGEDLDEALALLESKMPDGDTFRYAFERQQLGRQYIARYVLTRLEEKLSPSREKQLKSAGKVHLEHIMPRTLSPEWREFLGDDVDRFEDYVNRWGNLTFLYYSLNVAARNSLFEKKKKQYEASDVFLTNELCRIDTWDFQAIEQRQSWMAQEADGIWRTSSLDVKPPSPEQAIPESEELLARLGDLAAETSQDELIELRSRVLGHLSVVELAFADDQAVDFHRAKKVADTLNQLIDWSLAFDAEQRRLVRGAIEYFVLVDDEQEDVSVDGFHDDAEVLNAVCEAVGLPELKLQTTRGD